MSTTSTAASVGIIGGADGPTAIFVTGHPLWMIVLAVVAVVVVGLVLALTKK
jgi:Na+-transporting methylmalonyl-CoA/oxaloacetate decarboxylase beta subunit